MSMKLKLPPQPDYNLQSVCGCWFHDLSELQAMSKCIKDHLRALKAACASPSLTASVATPPMPAQRPPQEPSQNLMGLLHGAGSHTAAPAATPTRDAQAIHPSYSAALTPGMSGELRDLLSTAAAAAAHQGASRAASPQQQGSSIAAQNSVTALALSKEALRGVLMDMLLEDDFIDELHARFIGRLHQQRSAGTPVEDDAGDQGQQPTSSKKRKPRKKKGAAA